MDNEKIEKILKTVSRLIVDLESELLELRASVTVLKVTVASLTGEEPTALLAQLRDAEQKALQSLPISQRLQELKDLMSLLDKHGDDFGKHKA